MDITTKTLPEELLEKLNKLEDYIRGLGSLAVGFSGGVDSTFLIAVASKVLGDRAIAVTSSAVSVPEREISEARAFCEERGIRHIICTVDQLKVEEFRQNAPDRCYHCKRAIFSKIMEIAKENGIEYVAEGSNMDDLGDYRPGLRAVAELKVTSPLREAGLTKKDIRDISRAMGLPTWDKPAYACLATRLITGDEITEEKLRMIDLAEQFLIENGFPEERVRMHGDIARIEVVPENISRIAEDDMREKVYKRFTEIGFRFVTLDLHGYRMGSMNAKMQ